MRTQELKAKKKARSVRKTKIFHRKIFKYFYQKADSEIAEKNNHFYH